jgi:hypothetical protein
VRALGVHDRFHHDPRFAVNLCARNVLFRDGSLAAIRRKRTILVCDELSALLNVVRDTRGMFVIERVAQCGSQHLARHYLLDHDGSPLSFGGYVARDGWLREPRECGAQDVLQRLFRLQTLGIRGALFGCRWRGGSSSSESDRIRLLPFFKKICAVRSFAVLALRSVMW